MIVLITYTKIDNSVPLANLHKAIIGNSTAYWHHLNDTWIVKTNYSVNELYNFIAPNISTADRLLIVEIKKNYQGWLNKDAWAWLKNNF